MSRVVIIMDRRVNDSFPFETAAHTMRKGWKNFAGFWTWDLTMDMWQDLDKSGALTFLPIDEVDFEDGSTYVYLIPCGNDFDVGNMNYLRLLPEETLQTFANHNVNILFDYSLESFETWAMPVHMCKRCGNDLRMRNAEYSGVTLVASCNVQPPMLPEHKLEFIFLPGWINRVKRSLLRSVPSEGAVDSYLISNKSRLYLCMNKDPKFNRISMLHGLKIMDLLDDGFVSMLHPPSDDYHTHIFAPKGHRKHQTFFVDLQRSLKYDDFLSDPLLLPFEESIPDQETAASFYSEDVSGLTCFDVISETFVGGPDINSPALTEKTAKTLMYGKPFMINGSAGALRLLRKLGFRTFPYVFDESYDEIENMLVRQKIILDNVARWKNRIPEFMAIIRDHRDDLIHNHRLATNFPAGEMYRDIILGALRNQ